MKLYEAIEQTKAELLKKCNEVIYKCNEVVVMTSNTVTSDYMRSEADIKTTDVKAIESRLEIVGEIPAVKVEFEVKYPRKRKYNKHYEYYELVE